MAGARIVREHWLVPAWLHGASKCDARQLMPVAHAGEVAALFAVAVSLLNGGAGVADVDGEHVYRRLFS